MTSVGQGQVYRWLRKHPGPPWICYFCGKPILERHGNTREAFNGHHLIPGDEKSIVPTHKKCHCIHHNTGRVLSASSRRKIARSVSAYYQRQTKWPD